MPLARLFLHEGVHAALDAGVGNADSSARSTEQQDRVTELFDKYNLLALPVVDEERQAGRRDHGGRHHLRAAAALGTFFAVR